MDGDFSSRPSATSRLAGENFEGRGIPPDREVPRVLATLIWKPAEMARWRRHWRCCGNERRLLRSEAFPPRPFEPTSSEARADRSRLARSPGIFARPISPAMTWWHSPAEAFTSYLGKNALYGALAYPSLRRYEEDVVRILLRLFQAPPGATGSLTTGGTESIFMAVKTARDWARSITPPRARRTSCCRAQAMRRSARRPACSASRSGG